MDGTIKINSLVHKCYVCGKRVWNPRPTHKRCLGKIEPPKIDMEYWESLLTEDF